MLIGLTGAAGAGKDTVAEILACSGWVRTGFADALRIEVASAWQIDPSRLYDRAAKEQPAADLACGHGMNHDWLRYCAISGYSLHQARSPRWVLQQWGSWRRRQAPDYWVRHVATWLQVQQQRGHSNAVLTDVRYENEAHALRERGAHIVRVHRDVPALPADTASHESEGHGLIAADADVHNTGSLEDLPAEVWRVLAELRRAGAHA